MGTKYYPSTIALVVRTIRRDFGTQTPKMGTKNMPAHILWMVKRIQAFPETEKGSEKAAIWMLRAFKRLEVLGFYGESCFMDELRSDLENGNY